MIPLKLIKLLLSSTLLMACFAPAWAQSSFLHTYGTNDDERPYGIIETLQGNLLFFGSSGGSAYAGLLNRKGEIIWEHIFSETTEGDETNNAFQLNDTILVLVGDIGFQLQEANPRVTFMHTNGTILKDTFYALESFSAGGLMFVLNRPDKGYFVATGGGLTPNKQATLYFQKTDYQGKRLYYKQLVFPTQAYGLGYTLFKYHNQEKYMVVGSKIKFTLDTLGNQIGKYDTLVADFEQDEIRDLTQLSTGELVLLVNNRFTSKVVFCDTNGIPTTKIWNLPSDTTYSWGGINKTKNGGIVVAGKHILVLDSNSQQIHLNLITDADTIGICRIGESIDGGFYACGLSDGSFNTRNNDIYVYKTTYTGAINTAINEPINYNKNLVVYPNPSKGVFSINGLTMGEASAYITNMQGEIVVDNLKIENKQINCSALNKGIYILHLLQDNNYTPVKLLIY